MGENKEKQDWYFSLPWSYLFLKSSLHSIIMLNFLQNFKTVKLTFSLTVKKSLWNSNHLQNRNKITFIFLTSPVLLLVYIYFFLILQCVEPVFGLASCHWYVILHIELLDVFSCHLWSLKSIKKLTLFSVRSVRWAATCKAFSFRWDPLMDALVVRACLNHAERMVSSSSSGEVFRDLHSLENDGPQCE